MNRIATSGLVFLAVAVIGAVAATGAARSLQTHQSQTLGEAFRWLLTGRMPADSSAMEKTNTLRAATANRFAALSNDGPAYCQASLCSFACPGTPDCCDQTTCYYNNFWVDWSCCGTNSNTSNATCCGKMTGAGIAIIVILVLSFVACICGCVYCCCCRRPPPPVPMVAGSSTYVILPNGQMQPIVQGQPVAYGQPMAPAPMGSQAQFPGAQGGYQPQPQQQYMPPGTYAAAPPAYGNTTGTAYQPMS